MKPQVAEPGPAADLVAPLDADRDALPVPRRGLALSAGCLLGTLLLLVAFSRAGVAAFALGQPRTIPTMLAAGLLAVASGSAWLLGRSTETGRPRVRAAWLTVAGLLALLAVEQAMSLNHWIPEWLELPRYSILDAGVLGGLAALALGTWLLRSNTSRALWVAGAAAWLGGQLAEVTLGGKWQHDAAAGLELCGCALLALALLLALPPEYRLWEARGGRGGIRRLADRLNAEAGVFVRTARWKGREVLRLSFISRETSPEHARALAKAIRTAWNGPDA